MKNLKKIIVFGLLVCLALSMIACSGSSDNGVVGEWSLVQADGTVADGGYMKFNDDGTAEFKYATDSEAEALTYKVDGDNVIVTRKGQDVTFVLKGDTMEVDGVVNLKRK
ncbi:lipocalin family protein [Christensenella intestinihominis]|uniref:lipocalin family protein n=1 Tax=Christensenella intestinihominis TaxID=1851429 RepID=UPI00082F87B2|nr:lipocalin family protein [Christensenella intestinihominis]